MINMRGQAFTRVLGVLFWIIAVIILMATYGVLAKPTLERELNKGFFEIPKAYHNNALTLSVMLLTIGTFFIIYPFKK